MFAFRYATCYSVGTDERKHGMHLGKKVQLNIGGQPRIRGTLLAWVSTTNHDGEAAKNVLLGGVEYFNHFGEFWAPDSDASPCVVRAHSHLNNRKVVLV